MGRKRRTRKQKLKRRTANQTNSQTASKAQQATTNDQLQLNSEDLPTHVSSLPIESLAGPQSPTDNNEPRTEKNDAPTGASTHDAPTGASPTTYDQRLTTNKLESLLFQLTIFLIPTNLWLGFFQDQATNSGIIIDYLIPKLYLSDLVIVALLALWILRNLTKLPRLFATHSTKIATLALLSIPLIVSAIQSDRPISAYYFLITLTEIGLLTLWMYHHPDFKRLLPKPLILALLFQSLVGLVQWLQKSSLIGYLFLGETTLQISSNIAKTSIFGGEERPLPYGTTPHPNVLAGFLAIGLMILLCLKLYRDRRDDSDQQSEHSRPSIFLRTLTTIPLLLFTLITLALTQSVSAVAALAAGLILLWGRRFHWQNLLALTAIIGALAIFAYPLIEPESITRRLDLVTISSKMLIHKPLLGVGPNNFTATLNLYGHIPGPTRFLQPVHNIYLLWASETGLIGTLALLGILAPLTKLLITRKNWELKIPLLLLLFIGFIDHYPLTLQTGQLLLAVSLALALTPKKKST